MIFDPPLIECEILDRYKRFLADVRLADGRELTVHCPNSGSMATCWAPGWRAAISDSQNHKRTYRYTLEMTHNGNSWIGINTMRTNRLVEEALLNGTITVAQPFDELRREVSVEGGSRLDFVTYRDGVESCFIEVKNVTLRTDDGMAAFPDAVTKRGQKHLRTLLDLVRQGHRAAICFLVQRADVQGFRAAAEIDPEYAALLRTASESGVEVWIYRTSADLREIVLDARWDVFPASI